MSSPLLKETAGLLVNETAGFAGKRMVA